MRGRMNLQIKEWRKSDHKKLFLIVLKIEFSK